MQFSYTNNAFVDANSSFRNPIYNDKIATINFTQKRTMPFDKIISWDLSAEQDESIMGWLVTNENDNTLYDLYINSKGIIQANPNSSYLFSNLPATTVINFDNFDTSEMTNMDFMFQNSKVKNLDLTSFDTSKITTMNYLFDHGACQTLDLSSFNTSNVKYKSYSFRSLAVKDLDLSSFDTSNVLSMYCMFNGNQATILDLSSFNTSKVSTMEDMFSACHATSINVTSFDTSNVTSMYSMFCNLWNMHTSLDLSSFDTHKVNCMRRMFNNSQGLTAIYASENMVIPYDSSYMFNACGASHFTII